MKTSDLHRERIRVIEMCKDTNVSPLNCCKYGFAVAIIENTPVFVGDKLYLKDNAGWGIVTEHWTNINDDLYSLHPTTNAK